MKEKRNLPNDKCACRWRIRKSVQRIASLVQEFVIPCNRAELVQEQHPTRRERRCAPPLRRLNGVVRRQRDRLAPSERMGSRLVDEQLRGEQVREIDVAL
jgi:hypothetical protein